MNEFGEVLANLRKQKQTANGKSLTQQQLADLTGITRQHLSAFESQGKKPTYKKLQLLCRALATDFDYPAGVVQDLDKPVDINNEKLSRLVSAALGLGESIQGLNDDVGSLGIQSEQSANVKERWIFTDILAEHNDHAFLDTTIQEIESGVAYYYFIYAAQDWGKLDKLLKGRLDATTKRERIFAVECRSLICLTRISLTVGTDVRFPDGTITVGDVDAPRLKRLQFDQVSEILKQAKQLVKGIASQTERSWLDPSFGMVTLLYPQSEHND